MGLEDILGKEGYIPLWTVVSQTGFGTKFVEESII